MDFIFLSSFLDKLGTDVLTKHWVQIFRLKRLVMLIKSTLDNGYIQKLNFQLSEFSGQSIKIISRPILRVVDQINITDDLEQVVATTVMTVMCYKFLCMCTKLYNRVVNF